MRRWLIEVADGGLRLVEDEAGLRDLVSRGLLTSRTRVYEVGEGPYTAEEIPALARLLADAEAAAPLMRASFRSLERARFSEELAILNRPLEDDETFYDDPPRWRIKPFVAALAILALAGGAAYFKVGYRRTPEIVASAATSNGEPAPVGQPPLAAAPMPAGATELSDAPASPASPSAAAQRPRIPKDHPMPRSHERSRRLEARRSIDR